LANNFAMTSAGAIDANNTDTTLSGIISGTGALSIKNTGGTNANTLTLSGAANTYNTGGTTINGAITIGAAKDTAFGTGGVTFNNASAIVRNDKGSDLALGNAFIMTTAGAMDANGQNTTLSGAFSDAGALTIKDTSEAGGGTFKMGADNIMGNTGGLTIAASGAFDMNGHDQAIASVNNAGHLNIGSNQLTVSGNYTGTGNLGVILTAEHPNLNVTGTADISGDALAVSGAPADGPYDVVKAGTLTGRFVSITLPTGFFERATYTGTDAIINIFQNIAPPPSVVQSPGQAGLLAQLNDVQAEDVGIATQLRTFTPLQMAATLDKISPTSLAATFATGRISSAMTNGAVGSRMSFIIANAGGSDYSSLAKTSSAIFPGTLVAEGAGGGQSTGFEGGMDSRWGSFFSGTGSVGYGNTIRTSAGYQPGYNFQAAGGTAGVDYRLNDHLTAGLSAGYSNAWASIIGHGGSSYSQSARGGVYAAAYNAGFHAALYVGGADNYYNTARGVGFGRVAQATSHGYEFNFDSQVGYDMTGHGFGLSPFIGLGYDNSVTHPFTENGAGMFDMSVLAQTSSSLRSTVGSKLARNFKTNSGTYSPYFSAAWQHEFNSQSRGISAKFVSGGGAPFSTQTPDTRREAAVLGAGVSGDWGHGVSANLGYTSTLRSDFRAQTFNGTLRYKF
jgi:uncharacterized protein with beta-barrel porin domain